MNPKKLAAQNSAASHSGAEAAFSRLDCCAALAGLLLLLCVALPALASHRYRSDRIICANNLRQVGVGFLTWGHDNGDTVPHEVSVTRGGTRLHPLAANAWLHFSWISNDVPSPKIFFCPSEVTGRPASDFSGDPQGGYLHPNFANRATSYFLTHWSPVRPGAVIVGDRNLNWAGTTSCSRFGAVVNSLDPRSPGFGWRADLHGFEGNALLADGRVEQMNNPALSAAMYLPADQAGSMHLVLPR